MINQKESTHSGSWSLAEIQQLRSSHGRGGKGGGPKTQEPQEMAPQQSTKALKAPITQELNPQVLRRRRSSPQEGRERRRYYEMVSQRISRVGCFCNSRQRRAFLSPGVESRPSTEIYWHCAGKDKNCDKILVCRCTWNFHIATSSSWVGQNLT